MLESLISSRIRRTLLEYLLAHPGERCYLRGLSKVLGLSVSPLRRELKRLERSGMLTAVPEGNMLFYTVNTSSPAYLQLSSFRVQGSGFGVVAHNPEPIAQNLTSIHSSAIRQHPLRVPLLVGAAAGLLLAAGSIPLVLSRHATSRQSPPSTVQRANVTVVMPPPSASGAMRGSRWQLVPGGFGSGFGTASNERRETY
ncbi:MAG: winged helix-turn-helix transcriptional regulator [Candidatus Omnitrophica bacterium]|nr:winged helix-turn-helix transcriptional regulator [Candidatus Omnitrophota bacterium]